MDGGSVSKPEKRRNAWETSAPLNPPIVVIGFRFRIQMRFGHGRTPTKHGKEIEMELEYKEITEQIIGASFEVFRELGYGFL